MSVEDNSGTWLALMGMGVTWIIGAVTSHVSLRSKVQAVDERETERHDETRKLIDAMDERHSSAMGQMNDNFTYIRDRIDKVIDSREQQSPTKGTRQ